MGMRKLLSCANTAIFHPGYHKMQSPTRLWGPATARSRRPGERNVCALMTEGQRPRWVGQQGLDRVGKMPAQGGRRLKHTVLSRAISLGPGRWVAIHLAWVLRGFKNLISIFGKDSNEA